MIDIIREWLISLGVGDSVAEYLPYFISVVIIALVSIVANFITKRYGLRLVKEYVTKTKYHWDDVMYQRKVFEALASIVPAIIIYNFAPVFPAYQGLIQRIVLSCIVVIVLVTLNRVLNAVDDLYRMQNATKLKPIKGYIQVIKIILFTAGAIVIVSYILDRSPLLMLSGLGAATAIISLIFKDSILGLVASVQLSANDMIKIGDWIEMPSYGVDGAVIDITLHTVKVQNWDKTISTIPTQSLITGSFKNWTGMQESGGRRIKRSIYIDMSSIKFCDEELLERFKNIKLLERYIEGKIKEIKEYNRENGFDDTVSLANGRHLTNIGVFRVYLQEYINNRKDIHENMTRMVRLLQPTEKGLPIEIYAFTKTTLWSEYERIQADIFDHVLAVVKEFDLRLYQYPTGYDIRGSAS